MGKLKVTKKVSPVVSFTEQDAQMYIRLRKEKATIEAKMKEIATRGKTFAEFSGAIDANGSSYVRVGNFNVGRQVKRKVSFTSNAGEKMYNIPKYRAAVKKVTVYDINESVVEELVSSGKMSHSYLNSITDEDITYAIDIKPLAEMPEVEQATVKSAAARKK